jgi:hypothetical protein
VADLSYTTNVLGSLGNTNSDGWALLPAVKP